MTLNDGTTSITLPDSLQWIDEYSYDNVKQDVSKLIGGGIVISENLVTAGRPITLRGGADVWITKSVLDALILMRSVADLTLTLTLPDARVLSVNFDRSESIESEPVLRKNVPQSSDFFTLKIKFMEL